MLAPQAATVSFAAAAAAVRRSCFLSPPGFALQYARAENPTMAVLGCPPPVPQARRVLPMAAEFAAPMWLFGQRPYHVLRGGQILAVFSDPQEAGEGPFCSIS